MWRLVLTLTLCSWGSEATVTCRDKNDGEVDWYILYKTPKMEALTGLEYLYIDSVQTLAMAPSTAGYKSIKDPSGILANTLRPIFTSVRLMPSNFGFISYSDQPPGCSAHNVFGHSKGVLMVEKNRFGVWLLHSTPQFPFRRDQNNFWPDSGFENAQTFICVTFPYSEFSKIGRHLQYIRAFTFQHDIPDDFHRELIDATKWVQAAPSSTFQMLTSKGGLSFRSIAKQQSERPKDGDLYYTIAKSVNSHVYVQTWGCQPKRARSYCSDRNHKVYNIENIHTVLGTWMATADHSKWCVTRDQNRPLTCIADVNRAKTQYQRRGGALCTDNEAVRKKFWDFAGVTEDCPITPAPTAMDIDPVCEPDPDHSTDTVIGSQSLTFQ